MKTKKLAIMVTRVVCLVYLLNTFFMLWNSFVIHLSFCFRDIRKFKDAKKQFEKVSEEKENALVKNAQVQRNKQHEVEEATNILTATRKCFRHIALDYVLQVSAAIKVIFQNHLLRVVRDLSFRSSSEKNNFFGSCGDSVKKELLCLQVISSFEEI